MYVKMEGNFGYEFRCIVYDLQSYSVQQLMRLCAVDDTTEKWTVI